MRAHINALISSKIFSDQGGYLGDSGGPTDYLDGMDVGFGEGCFFKNLIYIIGEFFEMWAGFDDVTTYLDIQINAIHETFNIGISFLIR